MLIATVSVSAIDNNNSNHKHLTSDWFGIRNNLSSLGIDFELTYRNDLIRIQKNDQFNKPLFMLQNFDAEINLNLEKLIGLKGGSFLFNTLLISSHQPNRDILQSVQGISNIEANNNTLIYECFYHQSLFDEFISFKVGLIDFNTEFDLKQPGSNFITPSHGAGTDLALSGGNGPSIFPVTSPSLVLNIKPNKKTNFKFGFFDGIPGDLENKKGTQIKFEVSDGLFACSEISYRFEHRSIEKFDLMASIGAWYMTKNISKPLSDFHSYGFYSFVQAPLYLEKNSPEQGLCSYYRIGYVESIFNPTKLFIAAGFEYKGLIPSRDDDCVGIGFTFSQISDDYLRKIESETNNPTLSDSNIELFYKYELIPFLNIQPVIQYFLSPMLLLESKNIFVFGLRITIII